MGQVNRNQSWRYTYRVKRGLWALTWFLLFRPTPKSLGKKWRNLLLKIFGCKFNGDVLICPSVLM